LAPTSQSVPRSFIAAATLALIGAVVGAALPAPHTTFPPRTSFDEFPNELAGWSARRGSLQNMYLDALRLDDYVLADFQRAGSPPVNFYAAYYQTQDSTRAIHSPHDCIPGGGWEITKLEQRLLPATASTPAFEVNRAIIQLGATRQIVYYWFDERGRHLTNEYAARWYLFWDGLTRHRTDGALVRFVASYPPGANEADVDNRIISLASSIEPTLSRYVPH
jgi:EpsI family protein